MLAWLATTTRCMELTSISLSKAQASARGGGVSWNCWSNWNLALNLLLGLLYWHRQGRTECQGASAAATRQQQKRQAHRVGRLNRNTDRNSRLRLAEFDSAQQRIGLKRLEVVYGIMETLLLWSSTILETCPCPQETNSQRLVTLAARNFLCWSIHLPPISSWLSRLFLW